MALASLQGQTLGKYRVLTPLGRGGMARVYKGYHPQLDRYVAIKALRSDLVQDAEFLARFQREARSVAGLRHPNIIQVYDFDVQDDVYYMVMELLQGDTLKARLNDYRACADRMPWGEMARILLDVLAGLAYAHSEGMIHRDIKPANIMLTQRGQAVLADFGIAQIVGGTQHTVSGALMGTLNYMAPEQGLKGTCDARSDIYSLGIVFYEMMTQSIPFDADTPLAILMKHLNDPLPLPCQVAPDVPESFERVVLKSLAKRPQDRYQNAPEMARALAAAAQEAGIDLPERVSLAPLAATDDLSESVVILSGAARSGIDDDRFANLETDTTLGDQLAKERAAGTSPPAEPPRVMAVKTLPQFLEDLWKLPIWHLHFAAAPTVLLPIGVILGSNLAALWVSGWSDNWAFYEIGWPVQLLLVGLGLSFVMYATSSIWLLVPVWILTSNGVLFSYFMLTNNWDHWAFLWPAEPFLILAAIVSTVWLRKRRNLARPLSRLLGCGIGIICVLWSALVAGSSFVIGVLKEVW